MTGVQTCALPIYARHLPHPTVYARLPPSPLGQTRPPSHPTVRAKHADKTAPEIEATHEAQPSKANHGIQYPNKMDLPPTPDPTPQEHSPESAVRVKHSTTMLRTTMSSRFATTTADARKNKKKKNNSTIPSHRLPDIPDRTRKHPPTRQKQRRDQPRPRNLLPP